MLLARVRNLSIITIALILIGIGLVIQGAQQEGVYRQFPSPQTMTIEDFIAKRPTEGWFRITNGAEPVDLGGWDELDNAGSNVLKDCWIPIIQRDYVPSTGNFDDVHPAVCLIVHATDPRMVLTMSGIRYYAIKRDGDGLMAFRQQYQDDLVNYHSVTGLLRKPASNEMNFKTGRIAFSRSDFAVLEEGERPGEGATRNLVVGFGVLLLSIGFWVVQFLLWQAKPLRPYGENQGIGRSIDPILPRNMPVPSAAGDMIAMPVADPAASAPAPGAKKKDR